MKQFIVFQHFEVIYVLRKCSNKKVHAFFVLFILHLPSGNKVLGTNHLCTHSEKTLTASSDAKH